jgi:hypothetical protein
VPNQTTHASFFYVGLEWLNDLILKNKIGQIEGTLLM